MCPCPRQWLRAVLMNSNSTVPASTASRRRPRSRPPSTPRTPNRRLRSRTGEGEEDSPDGRAPTTCHRSVARLQMRAAGAFPRALPLLPLAGGTMRTHHHENRSPALRSTLERATDPSPHIFKRIVCKRRDGRMDIRERTRAPLLLHSTAMAIHGWDYTQDSISR